MTLAVVRTFRSAVAGRPKGLHYILAALLVAAPLYAHAQTKESASAKAPAAKAAPANAPSKGGK